MRVDQRYEQAERFAKRRGAVFQELNDALAANASGLTGVRRVRAIDVFSQQSL